MGRSDTALAARLGQAIRKARSKNGLTQQVMADEVGLSTEVYGRYERGETTPSVTTLCKLAKVLRTSTDELLGISSVGDQQPERPEVLRIVRALRSTPASRLKVIRAAVELMAAAPERRHRPGRK